MIEINVSDKVRFKLTERGKAILRHAGKADWITDDLLEWQLWEVMSMFGSRFALGDDPPIETTIQVDLNGRADLNEVTRGPDDAVGFLREVLREVDLKSDYLATVAIQKHGGTIPVADKGAFNAGVLNAERTAARKRLKKALVELSKPPAEVEQAHQGGCTTTVMMGSIKADTQYLRYLERVCALREQVAFAREEINLLKQRKANAEKEIERQRAEIARLKALGI